MPEPSEADAVRAPFTPTGRPYVLTVRPRDEDQPPNVFGPFPTADDVRAFLDGHPAIVARGYEYSVVWPPEDAAALSLNEDRGEDRPMVTDPTAPDAVVQIAAEGVRSGDWRDDQEWARAVCTALAAAGWLHDPAEVEHLRARARVAELEAENKRLRERVAELEAVL